MMESDNHSRGMFTNRFMRKRLESDLAVYAGGDRYSPSHCHGRFSESNGPSEIDGKMPRRHYSNAVEAVDQQCAGWTMRRAGRVTHSLVQATTEGEKEIITRRERERFQRMGIYLFISNREKEKKSIHPQDIHSIAPLQQSYQPRQVFQHDASNTPKLNKPTGLLLPSHHEAETKLETRHSEDGTKRRVASSTSSISLLVGDQHRLPKPPHGFAHERATHRESEGNHTLCHRYRVGGTQGGRKRISDTDPMCALPQSIDGVIDRNPIPARSAVTVIHANERITGHHPQG